MSNFLDEEDRLNLNNMIKSYGSNDNTEKIRSLRHSSQIKENIEIMINLKKNMLK